MIPPLRTSASRAGSRLRVVPWVCLAALAGGATAADAGDVGGVFVPAVDRAHVWRRTVATVADDWPVARVVEPDFRGDQPGAGVLESAWVEPADEASGDRPPRRQRLVVQFLPAPNGAWLDTQIETESLGGGGDVALAAWNSLPAADDVTLRLAAAVSPAFDAATPVCDRCGDPTCGAGGRGGIFGRRGSRRALRRGFASSWTWREDARGEPDCGPGIPEPDCGPGGLVPGDVFGTPGLQEPPWADSRFPRVARAGYRVLEDYRNFYSCEPLVCLTAAFGAGALMANTGFDTTMQGAWMRGVEPTAAGTFFSGCKDIGEGRYVLPIFGAAALTGLVFEGHVAGDVVGEWGSRSLRMFVVGAPPLYLMQWATGASRPAENEGSQWQFFADNNGVSGHTFVGAIPFLAAADMVESPLLKGTLYVCSTFVGFSRMTDNAHYPSQVFLGWYLAWASSRAVSATELQFANMEVRVVPLPVADLGGLGLEARW